MNLLQIINYIIPYTVIVLLPAPVFAYIKLILQNVRNSGLTRNVCRLTGEHSAAAGAPMQFTGQRYDYETSIYYLHARYYDPAQSRFFSFDPIGVKGGNNLYAYVNNDPLNLVDPTGLAASQIASAASNLLSCASPCLANEGEGTVDSLSNLNDALGGVPKAAAMAGLEVASAFPAEATAENIFANGLEDLAQFGSGLGLGAAAPGATTVSRLDVAGQSFYGISAHGQPITFPINAISASHAEADAFQQAINAGANASSGTLYVDNVLGLCAACGANGGVGSMMRASGITNLTVVTPNGVFTIQK